ncbi:hemerythrin domain-containing protein [Salipaludibacillus daqingensis]|uniref:hemerythrin domain-containing protein n=1 Tax=Salipaludibacillus daqingensis TaxID=3041001 RepID=UPI0024743595|nr:hemerythrin domain-containing protein [Salipaludibacillus daqingensis]
MEQFQGCMSHGMEKPQSYCQPLLELLEEHPPLRVQMEDLRNSAMKIKESESSSNIKKELELMYQQMRRFKVEIDLHSTKEEDALFEMMVTHIGRQSGPIAVMEEEHSLAKQHIASFFKKYRSDQFQADEFTTELAHHVLMVYQTLTDHFMKEEQILFPMAENMLSNHEKETLRNQFLKISG